MKAYTVTTRVGKYEIPEGLLVLECDFCHSILGMFDPEDMSVPIKGSMFKPLYANRGGVLPFLTVLGRENEDSWKYCTCNACGNNVFYDRKTNQCKTAIKTPFGIWEIGSPDIPRKQTQEDRNQGIIDSHFEEKEEPKSLEEENQRLINEAFPLEPEEREDVGAVDRHCRYCNKYYSSEYWLKKHEKTCTKKGE